MGLFRIRLVLNLNFWRNSDCFYWGLIWLSAVPPDLTFLLALKFIVHQSLRGSTEGPFRPDLWVWQRHYVHNKLRTYILLTSNCVPKIQVPPFRKTKMILPILYQMNIPVWVNSAGSGWDLLRDLLKVIISTLQFPWREGTSGTTTKTAPRTFSRSAAFY
jgi:hypothetical protein